MKKIKTITAVLLIVSILMAFAVPCSAAYESWNSNIENLENVSSNIKNQKNKGSCVFCATASAAESFVKLYYGEDIAFDEGLDKNPGNGSDDGSLANVLGYNNSFENLSNSLTGKALKPVAETEDNYEIAGVWLPKEGEEQDLTEQIKQAVYSYGAAVVYFNIPANRSLESQKYYHIDNCAYYCPPDKVSPDAQHAVCIVGWDDGYSLGNFVAKPEGNGAWICKNSYGEDFGEGGYFRISYSQEFFGALAVSVAKNGVEKTVVTMDDAELCTKLFVMLGSDGGRAAYAFEADGTRHSCKVEKDYTSNYYVVLPAGGTYFSNDTLCYLNSDKLPYGQNDDAANNPYYKCEQDGKIIVQTGEKGGFAITGIEISKNDLGYVKLIYDNNSRRYILNRNKDLENAGITLVDYKENPGDFDSGKYENLPSAGKGQHYAELKFSKNFVFDGEKFSFDSEKFAVRGEEDENGDQLMVIAVVVTESNPLSTTLELIITMFTSWIPLIFKILLK